MTLDGRRVVVAMGGGIAAYKAVAFVRELGRRGAEVRVLMTESATRFVGPVTLSGLTGRPPVLDLWDEGYAGEVHVDLAEWAELIVVAPATANLIARAAHGIADDVVSTTLSCARGPALWAPAMHTRMWERPATQRAVALLRGDGARFVGPVEGPLASGDVGSGRMSEPTEIADAAEGILSAPRDRDLAGKSVVVSAGPTVEDLDPVRFIGNRSSGKMGFALAAAARARGAHVTLVAGPVSLETPPGVARVDVRSALEMHDAMTARATDADVVVMSAAVADYRPASRADHKIKKGEGPTTLTLVRNPDILADLARGRGGATRPLLVGFAVETRNLVAAARGKLEAKGCDLVVANDASVGFAGDDTQVVLVDGIGEHPVPRGPKRVVAEHVLDHVVQLLRGRQGASR